MPPQEFHQTLSRFGLEIVKDAVAGAVVGGVLASTIPIPVISTVTGATASVALGACKSIGTR